jgi:hypothetical protein
MVMSFIIMGHGKAMNPDNVQQAVAQDLAATLACACPAAVTNAGRQQGPVFFTPKCAVDFESYCKVVTNTGPLYPHWICLFHPHKPAKRILPTPCVTQALL